MRFLVFFLLAIIAAVIAEEKTCEPGKPFKIWCNTCRCSPEGKPMGCTKMLCNRMIWNKNGTLTDFAYQKSLTYEGETSSEDDEVTSCEPGKPFKWWCNTCKCSPEGKPSGCTKMLCNGLVWNRDGTLKPLAYQESVTYDFEPSSEDDEVESCEPGKPFKLWCNTCRCSPNGKPAECTRKLCDRDVYNKDGTVNFYLYQEDRTNGGDRKRREVEGTKSCVPGKIFMRYCNTCRCSADGKPEACTEFKCDLNRWNEDGTVKLVEDQPDYDDSLYYFRKNRAVEKPVICPPGKVQWRYCNACTCSADGTELNCDNRPCANGEFDRNGKRPYQHFDIHF